MMQYIYVIYDNKAKIWMSPFYFRSRGECIRSLSDSLQDKTLLFSKHPEDFELYEVGSYDMMCGGFNLYPDFVSLGLLIAFFEKQEPKINILERINDAEKS